MKHVTYYNETQREALEYTSKVVDFGVTLILYSALNEVLNAHLLLRQSKHFKHDIKRRANIALSMRNVKVEELKSIVLHKGFAESYWDAIIDACEEDVINFRNAIKETMDEHNVPDSELLCQMETARVLLEAAKVQFEEVIKDSTNKYLAQNMADMKGVDLFKIFHEFYVDSIYREWNIVCEMLYDYKGNDVNLNTEKVGQRFVHLADKFAKGTYIDDCLKVAQEEHPEFAGVKIKVTE